MRSTVPGALHRTREVFVGAIALCGSAVVLWLYQAVDSPEPMARILACVLWLGVLAAAWWGSGAVVWRIVIGRDQGSTDGVAVLALGAGVLAAWAGILGSVGRLEPIPLAFALAVAAVVGVWLRPKGPAHCELRRFIVPALLLFLVAVATFLTLPSLSPQYDPFNYHLAFPFRWLATHQLTVFPRHTYSALPANLGLLYTYPLALVGPWGAQATNWLLGVLAVAGAGTLGSRLAGPRAGFWAAAAVATTPAAAAVSTWAGADLGTAAFAVAAACLVLPAPATAPRRRVALAGALVGAAVGCKLVAGLTVALPLAVLTALAPRRVPVRRRLSRVAVLTVMAGLVYLPWGLRAASHFGDPFYPYLGHLLGRPGTSEAVVAGLGGFSRGTFDPVAVTTLRTFAPRGEAGKIGPLWLAALPLALWSASRDRRRLGLALMSAVTIGVAGWTATPQLGRYLLPVLVLLAAPVAAGWVRALALIGTGAARRLTVTLAVFMMLWGAQGGLTPEAAVRAAATLGRGDERALLERYVTILPGIEWLNAHLGAESKVLLVGEARSFGIEADVVVEDPFQTPYMVELAQSSSSPEEMARRLAAQGVTHLVINHQEARRIAALNGRKEYFAPLDDATRTRLADFFDRDCTVLATVGPVTVLALTPAHSDGSPSR